MDTLLWPLKVAVAWVMVTIHKALILVGFPDGPGIAWVLSIIGLTIVVRLLIMPLFVKQIRASRGMQLLQPEMKALQAKYKGKKDPESRQRMNEEMMALYRKHGDQSHGLLPADSGADAHLLRPVPGPGLPGAPSPAAPTDVPRSVRSRSSWPNRSRPPASSAPACPPPS